MQLSAVVLTFNEEINITRCLASLAWCDDIVVVDSGSTDRTLAICAEFGVRVVHNPFVDFSTQRNFALTNVPLKHDWVLHLDADEEATPTFQAALATLEPAPGIYGYRVPSRTILFGQWLRRSGMYPAYQVRIGHRDTCRFYEHGHGQREVLPPEQVGLLDVPYDHHSFSHGLVKWFVKHAGYAHAEAEQILRPTAAVPESVTRATSTTARRRTMKRLANILPPLVRPVARFFYLAVVRRGFLDGPAGLLYCVMVSTYEAMIAVFLMQDRILRPPER
jgi:hypothetical protein